MSRLLKIAVVIALLLSGYRLYKFAKYNGPVVREGECIVVTITTELSIGGKVLQNRYLTQDSLVSLYFPGNMVFGVYAKWSELREMNAHKVDCQ